MKNNTQNNKFKIFKGSNYFRLKIAYSLLLNKPIQITEIHNNSLNPGLTKYELCFLKLISAITNGTEIILNKTGTGLQFIPGIITNNYGEELIFDTDVSRGLSYYLEGIIPIALYGKETLEIILNGVTNNSIDNSVDQFKYSTCTLLQKLIVGEDVKFQIIKRGVENCGRGQIKFKCPIITNIAPFDWVDEGKIKKVRGTAFTTNVSVSFANRMIDKARGVLNKILPDVWIDVDNYHEKNNTNNDNNNNSCKNIGYGICLVGETINKFMLSSDYIFIQNGRPEDIGEKCAIKFLKEIYISGCINVNNLGLFLFLMALSEKNYVSKMKVGKIEKYNKGVFLLIENLFGIKFNFKEVDEYDLNNDESEENEDINEENEDNDENINEDDNEDINEDNNEDNNEDINEDDNEDINEDDSIKDSMNDNDDIKPFKQYLISCIGIGLKNQARIELK